MTYDYVRSYLRSYVCTPFILIRYVSHTNNSVQFVKKIINGQIDGRCIDGKLSKHLANSF